MAAKDSSVEGCMVETDWSPGRVKEDGQYRAVSGGRDGAKWVTRGLLQWCAVEFGRVVVG